MLSLTDMRNNTFALFSRFSQYWIYAAVTPIVVSGFSLVPFAMF